MTVKELLNTLQPENKVFCVRAKRWYLFDYNLVVVTQDIKNNLSEMARIGFTGINYAELKYDFPYRFGDIKEANFGLSVKTYKYCNNYEDIVNICQFYNNLYYVKILKDQSFLIGEAFHNMQPYINDSQANLLAEIGSFFRAMSGFILCDDSLVVMQQKLGIISIVSTATQKVYYGENISECLTNLEKSINVVNGQDRMFVDCMISNFKDYISETEKQKGLFDVKQEPEYLFIGLCYYTSVEDGEFVTHAKQISIFADSLEEAIEKDEVSVNMHREPTSFYFMQDRDGQYFRIVEDNNGVIEYQSCSEDDVHKFYKDHLKGGVAIIRRNRGER